tara:strand:- start:490 stop:702 length:213 start_codon:yes stop_codon:yes gene_type:complete
MGGEIGIIILKKLKIRFIIEERTYIIDQTFPLRQDYKGGKTYNNHVTSAPDSYFFSKQSAASNLAIAVGT